MCLIYLVRKKIYYVLLELFQFLFIIYTFFQENIFQKLDLI